MSDEREFDLVMWGATGFTGRLTAAQLLRRMGVGERLRWAIGGRNQAKLESVRAELAAETGVATDDLPIVVGDGDDAEFLDDLTTRTRVVVSTVGPYARYGSGLVAACAANGTHYCDLTGEVHWMRQMIDAHGDTAESTGARIVFTCGFDSIPSDIGVWFVQQLMQERHGQPAGSVHYRVEGASGGLSGGTIDSMVAMMEAAASDPSIMEVVDQPYSLNPADMRVGPDRPEGLRPRHDDVTGQWVAPFMMAGINTKVVRRTNALLGRPWGPEFRYDEAILCGEGPLGAVKAGGAAAGTAAMGLVMRPAWLRRQALRVLPDPGEGPSPEAQAKGHFAITLCGMAADDPARSVWARVTGDRDPGYGSTSKMLAEAGLCLALDDLDGPTGCLTPAVAMGDHLLDRLPAHAGVTFEEIPAPV